MNIKQSTKLKNVLNYIKHLVETDPEKSYKPSQIVEDDGTIDGNNLEDFSYGCKDKIKIVDKVGGEGEGSYYHKVFSVNHPTYGEVLVKAVGEYDSWNGTEWYTPATLCEVRPVTYQEYVDIQDVKDLEISYAPEMKYLDFVEDVSRNWLLNILRTSAVVLEFTKIDGTQRVMTCTLNPAKIPAEKFEKASASGIKSPTTAFRVYDTEKKDWRSVRWGFINKLHIEV